MPCMIIIYKRKEYLNRVVYVCTYNLNEVLKRFFIRYITRKNTFMSNCMGGGILRQSLITKCLARDVHFYIDRFQIA